LDNNNYFSFLPVIFPFSIPIRNVIISLINNPLFISSSFESGVSNEIMKKEVKGRDSDDNDNNNNNNNNNNETHIAILLSLIEFINKVSKLSNNYYSI
jgi:hypothetical protein